MNYLLLIYTNEKEFMALGESELKKLTGEYTEFTKSIVQAGQFQGGRSAQTRLRCLHGARSKRQGGHHRWTFCRDSRAIGRLLPDRGEEP